MSLITESKKAKEFKSVNSPMEYSIKVAKSKVEEAVSSSESKSS